MEIALSIIVGILIANAMVFLLGKIFAGRFANKGQEQRKAGCSSCTGNCGGICSCCAISDGKNKHWEMTRNI